MEFSPFVTNINLSFVLTYDSEGVDDGTVKSDREYKIICQKTFYGIWYSLIIEYIVSTVLRSSS